MSQLRQEDWLHHAQGIAVGQVIRVPHKGDRTDRANLIIYNHADRWSAYCMSCKLAGNLDKTHVRIVEAAPKESVLPSTPMDIEHFGDLLPNLKNQILHFLARKGMDLSYLPQVFYSESRKRLVVQTPQGVLMGRDITDASEAKWLVYGDAKYIGYPSVCRINVVTEDLFSMFKVDHALHHFDMTREYTAVCSLGTGFAPPLMAHLIRGGGVVVFYDGDKAGREGAISQSKRVRAFGVPAIAAPAPEGFDPKDMTLEAIADHIKGASSGSSNSQRFKQETPVPDAS